MESHIVYGLNSWISLQVILGLLPARVQEHRDALRGTRYSAVVEHAVQTGHNIDWNNIKILPSDSKEINLFYTESFLILKQKPSLNKMQTSVNINLFT